MRRILQLLALFLVKITIDSVQVFGGIYFSNFPIYHAAEPGEVFTTEIRVSTSGGNALGAFQGVLIYDPEILSIVSIESGESGFFDSLVSDVGSYSTGETKLVGLRNLNFELENGETANINIAWSAQEIGEASSEIRLEIENVIDLQWKETDSNNWSAIVSINASIDNDIDGIPDVWEEAYFGQVENADPSADADGDGYNNLAEFKLGTNPQDATESLTMTSNSINGNSTLVMSFNSVQGKTYVIETSETLSPDSWQQISETIEGDGSRIEFDITGNSDTSSGFFRIRLKEND